MFSRYAALNCWLFICLLCQAPLCSAAEHATEGKPLTAEEIQPHDWWYGVYGPDGKKIGNAHMTLKKEGAAEKARYVSTTAVVMQMAAMGQEIRMQISETASYDANPPFKLLHKRMSMRQGAMELRDVSIDASTEKPTITLKEMGRERKLDGEAIKLTLADHLGIDIWLSRKARQVGEQCETNAISEQTFKPTQQHFKVVAVTKALVEGVELTCYDCSCTDSEMGDLGVARADGKGRLLSMKVGGMFELRFEPEELAKKIEVGGDLFVFGTLKADKKLGDPRQVTSLILELSGEKVDRLQDGPNQTASLNAAKTACTLKLGAASTARSKATDQEVAESLRESVDYPVKAPEVAALLKEALADAKTPAEKVEKLVQFVNKYMTAELTPQLVPVLQIIKQRRGDCSEHSMLFTTLARAAGIPCRGVMGLMYMGDEVGAFGGHAWNEVVLDGHWVEVDPTWKQTKVDATHIRFGSDVKGLGAALALLGQLKLKVASVEQAK